MQISLKSIHNYVSGNVAIKWPSVSVHQFSKFPDNFQRTTQLDNLIDINTVDVSSFWKNTNGVGLPIKLLLMVLHQYFVSLSELGFQNNYTSIT